MKIGKNIYEVKAFRYAEQFSSKGGTAALIRVKGYHDEETPTDASLSKLENAINRSKRQNGRLPRWVAITELWLNNDLVSTGISACVVTDKTNKHEGATRSLVRAMKEAKLDCHIEEILSERRKNRQYARRMAAIDSARRLLEKYGQTA